VKEGGPEEVMYFYISTLTTCWLWSIS
jgi:hypothetical protein